MLWFCRDDLPQLGGGPNVTEQLLSPKRIPYVCAHANKNACDICTVKVKTSSIPTVNRHKSGRYGARNRRVRLVSEKFELLSSPEKYTKLCNFITCAILAVKRLVNFTTKTKTGNVQKKKKKNNNVITTRLSNESRGQIRRDLIANTRSGVVVGRVCVRFKFSRSPTEAEATVLPSGRLTCAFAADECYLWTSA